MMTKIKVLLLLLVGAILVSFAVENALPGPTLKLLRFELGRVPVFLLVYASFALGFLGGWLTHFLGVKKNKRAAALAAEKAKSPQAPQEEDS
jgi:hypothetical protein